MLCLSTAIRKPPPPAPGCQFPFRYKTQGQARPSAVPTFYPLSPHTTPHSSSCPPPSCTYRSGQGLQGPPCCQTEGTPLRPYLHLVASPLADRTLLPVIVLPPVSYSFSAPGSSPSKPGRGAPPSIPCFLILPTFPQGPHPNSYLHHLPQEDNTSQLLLGPVCGA